MAVSRTWKLHLNLDEFNALTLSLYQDSDRALAFQGLALGFNGSDLPSGVPTAFRNGWALGKSTRDEAESFREGRKTNGKGGGRPSHRKEPHGIPHGLPNGVPHGEPVGIPHGLPNPIAESDEPQTENNNQKTTEKNQPHPIQTAAAVSTQDLPIPPRERPMIAPAATGWWNGLGAEVRANRCSERRQAWLKEQGEVDFTSRPGKLQFLSYCRSVHPQWQIRAATDAYDTWALRNWTHEGRKIGSWWQLVDAWALAADHTEYGERLPMGQFAAGIGLGDSMSAKASGLTKDLI